MFRIIFVFLLPCNPIFSLSNHSSLSSGCVFLFSVTSVMSIGSATLFFFRFDFYQCLASEFNRILVYVYKAFYCFRQFIRMTYRRNYSNRGSINNDKFYWLYLNLKDCFVEIYLVDAVDGLNMVHSGHSWSIQALLLSVSFSSCIQFTVLLLQTLAMCPVFLQILHSDFRAGHMCSGVHFGFQQKWQFRLTTSSFRCWTVYTSVLACWRQLVLL